MIRVFNPTPAREATSTQAPLGTERPGSVAMRQAATSMERTLAGLAALLAELDALPPPQPGPDGKVNTAAQQAYDERIRELQGKIAIARNASHAGRDDDGGRRRSAVRHIQVPVIASGLGDPAEPVAGS